MLLFVPALLESFEAPKAGVVRVLGAAALGAALVLRRVPPTPLDRAIAAWLVVEAVTTLTSVAPWLSLLGEPLQREGLLTSLGLAGCYVAARYAAPDPAASAAAAARFSNVLLGSAALSSLYAMLQAARFDPLHWRQLATYGPDHSLVRPFGTLGHPNLLGVVTAAALCVALSRAAAQPGRRWLWGPTALLFAAATLLTFSRGAWLAALAGSAATGLLLRVRARGSVSPVAATASHRARRWALVAAIAIGVVVLFAVTGWGRLFAERFGDLLSPTRSSGSSRLEIWRTALAMWAARPLVGQGPDTFGLQFPLYQTAAYWRYEWGGLAFQAHSVPLHTLATRGALGAAAALACAAAFAQAARRAWRAEPGGRAALGGMIGGVVAVSVAALFGAVGISGALVVTIFLALTAGLAAGGVARVPRGSRSPAVSAGVVALLMLGYVLSEQAASRAATRAQRMMSRSPAAAVAPADRAVHLAPFDDSMQRTRAEVLLTLVSAPGGSSEDLARAEDAARAAVRLSPRRALNHQRLGTVLGLRATRGDAAAALPARAAFDRARSLAPTSTHVLMERSRLELDLREPARADSFAALATALDSLDALAWVVRAECAIAAGDRLAVRAALDRALAGDWHGMESERRRARAAREVLR